MQAPKFSPGEPAIVESEFSPNFSGTRLIIMAYAGVINFLDVTSEHCYFTLPSPPHGLGWVESALRPLPPEELVGCFDANEVPRKDEVSA